MAEYDPQFIEEVDGGVIGRIPARAVDAWVFWVILAVKSGRWRVVWQTAGDAWVGDRRLPPFAGDARRTVVTPDAGQ